MSTYYVVGLMSGTSLDGVDAALVEIIGGKDGPFVKAPQFVSVPYSDSIRKKISALCQPETATVPDLSAMNMLLGELMAEAALRVIDEGGMKPKDVDLVSSHGQTVFHQPEPVSLGDRKVTSTLQIGDIGVIAERTGITTVGDFRTRDMAAGGQGAPLVPYTDYLLFGDEVKGRVLVNIGGIANVTVLPPGCSESGVLAYDTGPGNMIIDAFVDWGSEGRESFDRDGAYAAEGKVNEEWLRSLLEHEYYRQEPPKSTGREKFGLDYAKKLWNEADGYGLDFRDRIATVTQLTAETIAAAIRSHASSGAIVHDVLVSGGGRYNRTLMNELQRLLPVEVVVRGTESFGIAGDAKEAVSFALLGYQFYKKKTNTLPSATGAKHPTVMGKMAWGGPE